jgi:folylpolyglutamate synthase
LLTHRRIEHKLIPTVDRNLKNRFSAEVQERYAEAWKKFDPTATISREQTIEGALHLAREIGDQNKGMQALVTGSLHLVSGALYLLESDHSIPRLC